MTHSLKALWLLLAMFVLVSCQAQQSKEDFGIPLIAEGPVLKSPTDPRQYDTLVLANGLEVVFVQDPEFADTAVSISVNVGGYQNPDQFPGLAHYLEHMVLTNSTKYPEPNRFLKLISEHSGVSNAFSLADSTLYFFSINDNNLELALDMFSSALRAPLLESKFSQDERIAVDEEWRRNRESDSYVRERVQALTANAKHPNAKFRAGSLDTLVDQPEQSLQDALRTFHATYYSANLMKLAIASHKPIAEQKRLVEAYFGSISNHQTPVPEIEEPIYNKEHLQQHIHVRTKAKGDWMILQFDLGKVAGNFHTQPFLYLARLFNSAEAGALKPKLQASGLIRNMDTQVTPFRYINAGELSVEIELTDKGIQHKDEIVASVLKYAQQIAQDGVNSAYYRQMKERLELNWINFTKSNAVDLVNLFSLDMHYFDAKELLITNAMVTQFDPQAINSVVRSITADNMRIWHLSDRQRTNQALKYADGGFRTEPFTAAEKQVWQHMDVAVTLPALASEQVPLSLLKNVEFAKSNSAMAIEFAPSTSAEAWLLHSEHFNNPIAYVKTQIQTPATSLSAKNYVLSRIVNNVFKRKNQAIKDRAVDSHSMTIFDNYNNQGMTEIGILGRMDLQLSYMLELYGNFKQLTFTQADVDREVKHYLDSLNSVYASSVTSQLFIAIAQELSLAPLHFSNQEQIDALWSLTLDDLVDFHQTMVEQNFLNILVFGHYMPEQVAELTVKLREVLGPSQVDARWQPARQFSPESLNLTSETLADNVGLMDVYVWPQRAARREQVQLTMLTQLLAPALFNRLRTEQQMGYVVNAFPDQIQEFPVMTVLVESGNTELAALKNAVDKFLLDFYQQLQALPEDAFAQQKQSLLAQYNKSPDKLLDEANRYTKDWQLGNFEFDGYKQDIDTIRSTSKDELLVLYHAMFLSENTKNIVNQIKGTAFRNTEFYHP